MLIWNEQELRWYKIAEQNSTYFSRLAQIIARGLPPNVLVHDLGCGNGALAFRLAAQGLMVRAVDLNPHAVVEITRRNGETRYPVQVVQQDYASLEGILAYPIFCLCGDIRSDLHLLQKWQSKEAAIITPNHDVSSFKVEPTRRKAICSPQVEEFLRSSGLVYTAHLVVEEFGQPLQDLADAEAFVRHHNPHASRDRVKTWLEQNLQGYDSRDYPYYLPSEKQVTIFKIDLVGSSQRAV